MDLHLDWHDLSADHGVLELHERWTAPGPPLELHIVRDAAAGSVAAWWEDDAGTGIVIAAVGRGYSGCGCRSFQGGGGENGRSTATMTSGTAGLTLEPHAKELRKLRA
jgi:hypothetical protein